MRHRATVLADMELFDPPAPLQNDDEAPLVVGRWLHLADAVIQRDEATGPAD